MMMRLTFAHLMLTKNLHCLFSNKMSLTVHQSVIGKKLFSLISILKFVIQNFLRPVKSNNLRAKSFSRVNRATESPTPASNDDSANPNGIYGVLKDDFLRQPFKNGDAALKDALALLSQDDW